MFSPEMVDSSCNNSIIVDRQTESQTNMIPIDSPTLHVDISTGSVNRVDDEPPR
jgi:hypothetical protein